MRRGTESWRLVRRAAEELRHGTDPDRADRDGTNDLKDMGTEGVGAVDDCNPSGGVVDPATSLPRVLSSKCETCIFRPGNLMHLADGRRDGMVGHSLLNASWIVCHDTLSRREQGICRGFYDVHGDESGGVALARFYAQQWGLTWPECSEIPPAHPHQPRPQHERSSDQEGT